MRHKKRMRIPILINKLASRNLLHSDKSTYCNNSNNDIGNISWLVYHSAASKEKPSLDRKYATKIENVTCQNPDQSNLAMVTRSRMGRGANIKLNARASSKVHKVVPVALALALLSFGIILINPYFSAQLP